MCPVSPSTPRKAAVGCRVQCHQRHRRQAAKLSTGGGTSDGRFIAVLGAQIVELGVINASIHKVNEEVRAADIDDLHRMYVGVLERVLASVEAQHGVAARNIRRSRQRRQDQGRRTAPRPACSSPAASS